MRDYVSIWVPHDVASLYTDEPSGPWIAWRISILHGIPHMYGSSMMCVYHELPTIEPKIEPHLAISDWATYGYIWIYRIITHTEKDSSEEHAYNLSLLIDLACAHPRTIEVSAQSDAK